MKRSRKMDEEEEVDFDEEDVRFVAQSLGRESELKWYDFAVPSPNFATAFTYVYDVSAIAQGVGVGQRTGDRIRMKNLSYFIHCVNNSAGTFFQVGRVTLFQWKASDAVAPLVTDIYEGSGWNAPFNMAKRSQYKILLEKRFFLIAPLYGFANAHMFEGTLKFKGPSSIVQYQNGTTTGINKIYLCFTAGYASGPTSMNYRGMIRFTDH